jgi:signal transduction histidine kinase
MSLPSAGPSVWLTLLEEVTENAIHLRELEIYAQELGTLYQANQRQLRKLQEAEQARDLFYSLVTHELKTPLTSLRAALEMITLPTLLPQDAQQARTLVDSMRRSSERLEKMINDLLDLATAKSGGLRLVMKPLDIVECIRSVQAEMMPLAMEKELRVSGIASNRAALMVEGDETRLQQVLQNLLSNAIKAAPRHEAIRMAVKREAAHARVTVTNTGVTIDPALAQRLFEPFRKSSANGYRAGAGLGLSVVDALVRAHHGSVEVIPRSGQVAFAFTVPLWNGGDESEDTRRRGRSGNRRNRSVGLLTPMARFDRPGPADGRRGARRSSE